MGRVVANSIVTHTALTSLLALPETLGFINDKGTGTTETDINKTDDCFSVMSSYWQKGDYHDIVTLADIQPIHCLCDIRIAIYYLYSLWLTEADITTETILSVLISLLNHHQKPWKAMLINKKDDAVNKILENGISILVRKIVDHLRNPSCNNNASTENPDEVLHILVKLTQALPNQLTSPNSKSQNSLTAAKDYYFNLAKNQGTPKQHSVVEGAQTEQQPTNDSSVRSAKTTISHTQIERSLFQPSDALQNLYQRMLLLQALLQKHQLFKAAVVLTDIQEELDNFNPLLYFPEYFSAFASARAQSAAQLEPYFSMHESFQWQALNECYKTDMEAFLKLPETPHSPKKQVDSATYETIKSSVSDE